MCSIIVLIQILKEAIARGSYMDSYGHKEQRFGDPEKGMAQADHVIENEITIGGQQEHFYMETNCCIAIPNDDDGMEIRMTTQCPSMSQVWHTIKYTT